MGTVSAKGFHGISYAMLGQLFLALRNKEQWWEASRFSDVRGQGLSAYPCGLLEKRNKLVSSTRFFKPHFDIQRGVGSDFNQVRAQQASCSRQTIVWRSNDVPCVRCGAAFA